MWRVQYSVHHSFLTELWQKLVPFSLLTSSRKHLSKMSRYTLWEVTSLMCICLVMFLSIFTVTNGLPYHIDGMKQYQYDNVEGADQPDLILEMLARLSQSILRENDLENSKRGLDLGLSRGFSGSQAAKHLMGLAAANYAGGPGRRRRSDSD